MRVGGGNAQRLAPRIGVSADDGFDLLEPNRQDDDAVFVLDVADCRTAVVERE